MRFDCRTSLRSSLVAFSIGLAAVVGRGAPANAQGSSSSARAAATISAQQFRALRWLAGDWRGRMPDGKAFHERYRYANDSTLVVTYFNDDSSFANSSRTDSIALRGGVVHKGRSTVTRLDDAGVAFADLALVGGGYDFARLPGGSWTATIKVTDADGKPKTIVYHMQRVGR